MTAFVVRMSGHVFGQVRAHPGFVPEPADGAGELVPPAYGGPRRQPDRARPGVSSRA